MTAPTHIAFSELLYFVVLTATGVSLSLPHAIVVGVFSVLPDLDTGASRVGRLLPRISRWMERRFGHRTLTHSALGIILLAGCLLPLCLFARDTWVCAVAGFASHPFLDTMTLQGVKLWYPFSQVRCVFPLDVNQPKSYRTQTGSRADAALGAIFLIACVPAFLIANEGYERFVRVTQRTVESAVRDYNEFSQANLVLADISGHNLLTKARVNGTFEIVGTLNAHTLIFRGTDERLHTLGAEYQAEYVAERAVCRRGKKVVIQMKDIALNMQPLREVLSGLDPAYENQLFGQLHTADRFSLPEPGIEFSPITGTGNTLLFKYAFYDDILALDLDGIFIERGVLTVRTIIPEGLAGIPPAGGGNPADSASSFSKISFQVLPQDSLVFLCAEGDSVHAGQLLARWGESVALDAELAMLREKRLAIAEGSRQNSASGVGKLAIALQAQGSDSAAVASERELLARGFASTAQFEKAVAKYRKSKAEAAKLRRELAEERRKAGLAQRALDVRILGVEARGRRSRARTEARSTTNGVIHAIHSSRYNGKLSVTISIRGPRNGRP